MKYFLFVVLIAIGAGVAGPPLYFAHSLPMTEAIVAGLAFSFAFYLVDPTHFLSFSAEARKNVKAWFTKDSPPAP